MISNIIGYLVHSQVYVSRRITILHHGKSITYYTYKMNIKMNLLEHYVSLVDFTKKQKKYFKIVKILFVVTLCLSLFFVLFNYLNEK